jgi:CarD family transcriptional regulator
MAAQTTTKPRFRIGDRLVYPNHGVVVVEDIGESPIMPAGDDYYQLRLLANNSRLMIPVFNQDRVGLRRLFALKDVKLILQRLENFSRPPVDWHGRYHKNLLLMQTGRLEDVVEVLQSLFFVSKTKYLSFREQRMYDRAKHLLVSEIAVVKDMPETEAERLVFLCLEHGFTKFNTT